MQLCNSFPYFMKWSEHFIMYWSFVMWSSNPLNIICFEATTIAEIFYDTELYFMTFWDSELLWEWQIHLKQLTWRLQPSPCSALSALSLPRFKLFNLFTPTPGRLGHNSSVIVFFWENKPGSWLPQNCLLPVFWLVRSSQLRPLIGQCHTEHLGTEHQRSHILPSSDVCCNNQLSLYPTNKGSRFGCDEWRSSMPVIFGVIAEAFRWQTTSSIDIKCGFTFWV